MSEDYSYDAEEGLDATALFEAAAAGSVEAVRERLRDGSDATHTDDAGRTILHVACQHGHDALVALLLSSDVDMDVDVKAHDGQTALHVACLHGRWDIVSLLFRYSNASTNVHDGTGNTPLHYACELGHETTVSVLLTHSASVHARNESLLTPLHIACRNKHEDIAIRLINAGAECSSTPDRRGLTPLAICASGGLLRVVEHCVRLEPPVFLSPEDEDGRTPLYHSYRRGHIAIMDCLRAHGAAFSEDDLVGIRSYLERSDDVPRAPIIRAGIVQVLSRKRLERTFQLVHPGLAAMAPEVVRPTCREDALFALAFLRAFLRGDAATNSSVADDMAASHVPAMMAEYLRSTSVAVEKDPDLHLQLYALIADMLARPLLAAFFAHPATRSLSRLLSQHVDMVEDVPACLRDPLRRVQAHLAAAPAAAAPAAPSTYEDALAPLLVEALPSDERAVSGANQRALMRELRDMRRSLSCSSHSSVFLRFHASNVQHMEFCIAGPPDTPYDSGLFFFDMHCTDKYPAAAPAVRLLTTGGGTVRFNPNLYKCGKVCLSLLGTWAGPGWIPDVSNLTQVMVSIQSHILGVALPVYNEPGITPPMPKDFERLHGNGGWEQLRLDTVQWAMIHVMKHPPRGFEKVVRLHFTHKRDYIASLIQKWADELAQLNSRANADRLVALGRECAAIISSAAFQALGR